MTVDEVKPLMPAIEGTELAALRPAGDGRQLHASWCVAGTSAEDAARALGSTMTAAGWTAISSRGDAVKAGVSGERGDYRLSLIVSASSAATCAAPGHYLASATVFRLTGSSP